MSIQLQNILIALCEGAAMKIVQRQEESENGFEAWRQLTLRFDGSRRSKATGHMTTILQWNFNMKDFEASFNDWEAEIEKYNRIEVTDFPDEVKIGILMTRISGPLQEHLMLNQTLDTPWADIRNLILNYFKTGRLVKTMRIQASKAGSAGSCFQRPGPDGRRCRLEKVQQRKREGFRTFQRKRERSERQFFKGSFEFGQGLL